MRKYLRLGLMVENVRTALQGLEASEEEPTVMADRGARILVFSGHRIDAPNREAPRFPPERAEQAREMIRAAVVEEQALAGNALMEGIAGGASGGDILFHEVCEELDIPTVLLLALPPDAFAARSVADAGAEWMERFRRLRERVPLRVLNSEELPEWVAGRSGYSIWQRNNLWILHTALSRDGADVTLIVLWDGRGGDGPGGTKDMVEIARSRGVKVVHLDARVLIAPQ